MTRSSLFFVGSTVCHRGASSSALALAPLLFITLTQLGCLHRQQIENRGTATAIAPSPWDSWVMFDQPEIGVQLGDAFDLSGAPDTGCYSYVEPRDSAGGSWAVYHVAWHDTTNASLRVSIATGFGLGGSMRSASQGSIDFVGLVVRRARNVGPRGRCIAALRGLPRKPVIVALLGADSLSYVLSDSANVSIDAKAEINSHGGNASFGRSRTG